MKFNMKNLIKRQSIVLGSLTLLISVLLALAGAYPNWKDILFVISVFLVFVYIGFPYYYDNINQNIDKLNEKMKALEKHRKAFEKMMSEYQAHCRSYAKTMEDEIYLDFEEVCHICCESIYRVIEELKIPDAEISITYETYYKRFNKKYIKMVACKNKSGAYPNIYKQERVMDKNGYYDTQVLLADNPEIIILSSKEEIKMNFKLKNKDNICKYNQYIGIPIVDDKKEILGLLQIITFGDTELGKNKEDIRKIIVSYGMPFASLFLLFEKTNLIQQTSLEKGELLNVQTKGSRAANCRKAKK